MLKKVSRNLFKSRNEHAGSSPAWSIVHADDDVDDVATVVHLLLDGAEPYGQMERQIERARL